jgi:hypothetical protein
MEAVYVDQVEKLDIKALMAKVLKVGRSDNYCVTVTMNNWPQIEGQEHSNQLTIDIVLERPADCLANAPLSGEMLLKYILPDGGKREQMLLLRGVPATKRSWRWRTTCPYSGEHVQTLYFHPSTQQFVSRKVAGLKHRPKLSKVYYRHLDRMLLIMKELGINHPGPWISKPLWMTQARFELLTRELVKADIRRTSAMLGIEALDFPDEDEEVEVEAELEPLPVNDPQSLSMYYRDQHGTMQMKAKYKQKYGLPEGA